MQKQQVQETRRTPKTPIRDAKIRIAGKLDKMKVRAAAEAAPTKAAKAAVAVPEVVRVRVDKAAKGLTDIKGKNKGGILVTAFIFSARPLFISTPGIL